MRVGIVGVRGVPNVYGGFEQFTEYLSKELVNRGHEVSVYSPHHHPFQEKSWHGVEIIHKSDPENLGSFGQFIYDFNCIADSRKRQFDVILQLGYTSSSVWHWLFPKNINVVTNMDGLEWKRSKFSKPTQTFLKYAEKLAAVNSHHLIADSLGIQEHLQNKYALNSSFIPYGANLVSEPNTQYLGEFELLPHQYDLIVARMEPENNIEMIVKGFLLSQTNRKLIVIGNHDQTPFGRFMKANYKDDRIAFVDAIYDIEKLNCLRWYSNLYFHGHSVGGTNPSLLEAMASNGLICAHQNIFNHSVCGDSAFYFKDEQSVKNLVEQVVKSDNSSKLDQQRIILKTRYDWNDIISQYEQVLIDNAQ